MSSCLQFLFEILAHTEKLTRPPIHDNDYTSSKAYGIFKLNPLVEAPFSEISKSHASRKIQFEVLCRRPCPFFPLYSSVQIPGTDFFKDFDSQQNQ